MAGVTSNPAWTYKNITSTTTLSTVAGQMGGIFVASASSSPTIKVEDSAGTTFVNTFTPAAATWYPMPGGLANGLKVTIGGTVDCTVFYL